MALQREEPSQSSLESKPRVLQIDTNLISGSSVEKVDINNCTVIGQQHIQHIHSVNLSAAKKNNVWFNMREPIPSYTGREDILEEVHNIFLPTNNKPNHQVALVGLGGIGKSEFARKFAHIYYTEFDGNVAWINAETAQLLIDSFKGLATHIGIKFAELLGKAEILQMVDAVYEYFGERSSLFIFDNVESWVDGKDAVRDYLPNRMAPDAKKPFVLMTSRLRPSGIKIIQLSVLEVAEAVELIQKRLDIVECVELLSKLANLLGCLPLALQQASSYIKQEIQTDITAKSGNELTVWCIERYTQMFDAEAKKLLDYKSNAMDVTFEELKTTLLTWRITLKRIEELDVSTGARNTFRSWFPNLFPRKSSKALKLLGMMSYISPDGIHLEMFEKEFTGDDLRDAANTLIQFSMIYKHSANSNIISVHRLVQSVVRLDKKGISLKEMLKLLNVILEELPNKITPYTTSCVIHAQVAWEHALAYPELLKQFEDYPLNLYNGAKLHGMHTSNLSLLQRTLSKYKLYSIYGESDEQYILTQHLIAWALLELHKYEDAKSLYQIIHKTAAEKLGESHWLTLAILNGLAVAESGLGNYSEEIIILDKVIAIQTATPTIGPYQKATLISLHIKAVGFDRMGKYDEALDIFKSTLELWKKHHPEDRKSINDTRYWIAITTRRQGNFAEALQMFRNLHAEWVESFGESHTDTLSCARQIGECLLGLGKYEEAMELLKYNLNLAIDNLDARLQCADMQFSIGKVLLKMERHDEAVSQFRIALDEELSIFGETHTEVQKTRVWLADALKNAGCTEVALEHYKFVYNNLVKTLGAEHPNTIRVKEKMENMQCLN